jgi:hypothetical protein
MQKPVEAIGYPGFYIVPGHSRYVINPEGIVLDTILGEELVWWLGPNGYYNLSLATDDDYTSLWGRHRLLAVVFKHPGVSVKNLVVNHINAIKGDDRLDNLEWITQKENAEHAGKMGITEKCIPICVRDVDTGKIEEYPSFIECARAFNMTKDAISYRVNSGEERVFPERKQYRLSSVKSYWKVPENIELALMVNSTSKPILMRDVLDGKVLRFDQLTELADYLDLPVPTISTWMKAPGQPVLPGLIQIKWAVDTTPWRETEDPYLDHERFTGKRTVRVTSSLTGESSLFVSAVECARAYGIKPTALAHRLKSNGEKVYSDGFTYEYYRKRFSEITNSPAVQ